MEAGSQTSEVKAVSHLVRAPMMANQAGACSPNFNPLYTLFHFLYLSQYCSEC